MKFKTFFEKFESNMEVCKTPSCTVSDDYEDLATMVKRIIRGEVAPKIPQVFEFSGDDSKITDDDFDRPTFENLDDLTDITESAEIIKGAQNSSATADTQNFVAQGEHGSPKSDAKPEISASEASDAGASGAGGN